MAVFSETIKIVLRNVELEKMTTIKIVPTSEIWPPEAVLRGGVININRTVPSNFLSKIPLLCIYFELK